MRRQLLFFVVFVPLWMRASPVEQVDASRIEGKVLLGYQGWFDCPPLQDGVREGSWSHWLRKAPAEAVVDLYPDLREFAAEDLCAVPGLTLRGSGKQAFLYSAANPRVVAKHFQWMRENGLDGVLVQRFLSDIPKRRATGDVVLRNIMAAAKVEGRVFAIEYDVSGAKDADFARILTDDWQYLVRELKITGEAGYLRHRGRPLVSVWGMGFNDNHPPVEPEAAEKLIAWFHSEAPEECRTAFMGGVPSRWRSLTADARQAAGWQKVYASMDVIQPWTVGRYGSEEAADRWAQEMLVPDLARTRQQHQLYMPVIFPGFSWANLNPGAKQNQIPRNGGRFLWRQAENARKAGATLLKIAMFDEVNEGTAVMKAAPTRAEAPDQGYWLTLDADGEVLPSDWYLRLSGKITRLFHGSAN